MAATTRRGADLGGAGHQSWVVTSYLLASTIATAVVGKLGDLYGRKAVFCASILFFFAGSVLCGMSSTMTMLVASRTLQGIGGGAVMVTAADIYTRARARGHDHPHAVRILARSRVRVIYRCWHTHQPYNPNLHGAAQKMHNAA